MKYMKNLIGLCTVYISDAPILNFIWMYISRFRVFIYILFEDSLMSRDTKSLSPFWFRVYWYISVPVHVDLYVQLLIHGQYCRSCPVWDGGGGWAGHRPSTAPPPQRGQQTSPGVSKSLFTYRVSKSGCLFYNEVGGNIVTHLCLGICGGLCLYRENSHVWKFQK